MHYATRLGLPSVVKLLYAHGADVNAANHGTLTPFHLVQQGLRDPRDLLSSPRMTVRFMQCATILAENAAVQTPPPPDAVGARWIRRMDARRRRKKGGKASPHCTNIM